MDRGQQLSGREPCEAADVALTRVFGLFGKRWTGLIVAVLTQRPAYFAELRRAIPKISERMLSDRLTELGDAGLVVREVDHGPPLRVSYGLTEAGLAFRPALAELGSWAEKYLPDDGGCIKGSELLANALPSEPCLGGSDGQDPCG
jgi:DNA-binding HxlR family transcriptional regulator